MSNTELTRLADMAESTADSLHDALCELQVLRHRMLSLIEDLGGDREFNWSLQADLGYAESAIWSASQKARVISRHARVPALDNQTVEVV